MSQIWSSSSCSLPACASALLHALKARSARFSRRSSLLIKLSLTVSAADASKPAWAPEALEKEEDEEGSDEEGEHEEDEDDDVDEDVDEDEAAVAETPRASESVPSNSGFPCVMEPANSTSMEFCLAVVYRFAPSPVKTHLSKSGRTGDPGAIRVPHFSRLLREVGILPGTRKPALSKVEGSRFTGCPISRVFCEKWGFCPVQESQP
jgi:hypothetical protein